jgi:thiamine kinase-like enzyme
LAAQVNATLTHTDCRAENSLFGGPDGHDAITMIDFQLCTKFNGMYDVANLISGSLTPENRQAWEQQLVERYHQNILALGVAGYSLERCKRDYRACLLLQAFGTVVVSDLDGGSDRSAELLTELLLRPALSLNDHDHDHDVTDIIASFRTRPNGRNG